MAMINHAPVFFVPRNNVWNLTWHKRVVGARLESVLLYAASLSASRAVELRGIASLQSALGTFNA